jgi:Protein of unknown function (DUF2997)
MQQVEITIEAGVPTIKVKGAKGASCRELTWKLEQLLGEKTSMEPTKEMYEQTSQTAKASY